MTSHPFRAELRGYFYTVELYDRKGRQAYDLQAAVSAAEDVFGDDWDSVYNGTDAITREEFLAQV